MPKKYIIYRDGDSFIFEVRNENGEYEVEQSVSNYNKIIEEFIKNGYSITYDNDEVIRLTSNYKERKDRVTIAIIADERLMACKYMSTLKKDIQKVKKAKGYTHIRIDENGKRTATKYPGGLLKKIQDHAAIVGTTIAIVGLIMLYGIYAGKSHFTGNTKKDISNDDKYSMSMTQIDDSTPPDNTSENSLRFPDIMEAPWNIDENGLKVFPFQKSLLINDYFFNNILEKSEGNKPVEVQEEEKGITIPDPNEIEYNKYLTIYAEYFHLDSEKVIEFAKKVTNNYTIPFDIINGTKAYDLSSKEAACLVFVHNLNRNNLANPLEEFGLSQSDFVLDETITTLSADKILSNGQTFEQFFGHVCDLLNCDKYWLLGITYLETGHVESPLALNNNNFGGLRGKDGFYTYITPEAGIIAHCRNLKNYEYLGLRSIYELAGKYVYGNQNLIYEINNNPDDEDLQALKASMDNWISSVRWFHYDFLNRSDEVFAPIEETIETEDSIRVLS